MRTLLGVVAVVLALPGVVTAAHLTALTVASFFYREKRPDSPQPAAFLIVIPARNEETVIRDTVDAVQRERRPADIVLVAADRCTDRTAEIARDMGAEVLERPNGAPPGRAASIRDAVACANDREWDALVMIDADSVVGPGYFDACERALAAGVAVAQTRSESVADARFFAQTSVVASSLQGVTVPRGQEMLRCSVRLKGSGTMVRRDVLARVPLAASGASESTLYGLDLTLAGVKGHHIDDARLRFATAGTLRAAGGQRLRWESGRLFIASRYLGRLLKARTWPALESAVFLATPPFAVAALLLCIGIGLTALAGWFGVAIVLSIVLAFLAADVVVALLQARAGVRTWLALAAAPTYILWKGWIQLKALRNVRAADQAYEPTPR